MSKVYYARVEKGERVVSLAEKTIRLLQEIPTLDSIKKDNFVSIKTHFGEKGNIGHIDPQLIRYVAEFLGKRSERVFVTDTNTLYKSSRSNAVEHMKLAYEHRFDLSHIGIPVIIADGLRGRNHTQISISGKHFKSVKIASDIVNCEFLLCLSHVTGHMQTGFGATIKNLGMGCASRAGKLDQHSNVLPSVVQQKCTGCLSCVKYCPADAIEIKNGRAVIVDDKCIGCGECTIVCESGAIQIRYNESIRNLQEKMAEYALGVTKAVGKERMCYVNFLTHITKDCDCMAKDEPPICSDIGIMASSDPVALDKASTDVILEKNGKDIFKIGYPEIDWSIQLTYGEAIGLGSTDYALEELVRFTG